MRTTELTFTEAVQAIVDGRCKEIRSKNGAVYHENEVGVLAAGENIGIILSPAAFLEEWSLIMPLPRWKIEWKEGNYPYTTSGETIQDVIEKLIEVKEITSIVKIEEKE